LRKIRGLAVEFTEVSHSRRVFGAFKTAIFR
jgi:hypothetical protein